MGFRRHLDIGGRDVSSETSRVLGGGWCREGTGRVERDVDVPGGGGAFLMRGRVEVNSFFPRRGSCLNGRP
eukprot:8249570-Pyramimonas_sp.AAC.1